jgi:ADP-ribosylglycohydrolase
MVAQALVASGGNINVFRRSLGWRLRFWLFGLPAGVGMATLRSIIRLWIGFPPDRSGVFSAGNGPAMRTAILGTTIDDRQALRELVRATTQITHTDPKAEYGAFAIALAAQMACAHETASAEQFLSQLQAALEGEGNELISLIQAAATSVKNGEATESFAQSIGLPNGVSGYVYHSVPVAIHAWLRHPRDFRSAVTAVIQCGGDTDSTAAIVGGIVGAAVGKNGIPSEWLKNLFEWPRSVSWMERLGVQLDRSIHTVTKERPIKLPLWGLLPRNVFFLIIILCHGLRRLLPPY